MEFTDEQLAEIKKISDAEADRRVTQALQTAQTNFDKTLAEKLQSETAKAVKETEDRLKLSAEELAQQQLKEREDSLAEQARTLAMQTNNLLAKEKLTEAGVTKDEYESILGVMVSDDQEQTSANVDQFISVLNKSKTDLENRLRAELAKVPAPDAGGGGDEITADKFKKMTYAEKIALKTENPELFRTFIN